MEMKDLRVEPKLTGYLFSKASRCKVPLSGTFELSPECNFRCGMCYVRKTHQEVQCHPRAMLTIDQWVAIAKQARAEGMLYLLLTGGEPLLWPDFWELYEILSKMGFLISINTNGSLIDEHVVEKWKQMPPTRINITLYGAGDQSYERLCHAKGAYQHVIKAVQLLQDAGIVVKLNGSLTPNNVSDLEQCVEFAQKHGLIYETTTYMFPPIRRDESMVGRNERFTPEEAAYYSMMSYRLQYGEELYRKYLEKIVAGFVPPIGLDESCVDPRDGKIRCRAGKASFWITWDGWLTPCGMMPYPKVEITDRSFSEAWKKLTEICDQMKLSSVCGECPNRSLCHACAAMAEAETGDPSGIPRYLCEMVTAQKQLADKELARMKEYKGGNGDANS